MVFINALTLWGFRCHEGIYKNIIVGRRLQNRLDECKLPLSLLGLMAAPLQNLDKLFHLHRLADVVVHARFETFLLVALESISGDGNNFRSFLGLKLPYDLSGSDAVHFWHPDIHKNQIVRP